MQIIKIPTKMTKKLFSDQTQIQDLSKKLKVNISLDNDEGVVLEGESIDEFVAKSIIQAIGRGFEIRTALKLLKNDYELKIIDLSDYFSSRNKMRVVKGRIIGTKGKTKKTIESATDCFVSVYGKTISIIGEAEKTRYAFKAIKMIVEGATHRSVYRYLEKIQIAVRKSALLSPYKLIDNPDF